MELKNNLLPPGQGNTMGMALATREAQEVQAQMIIAQNFPRNYDIITRRINEACSNYDLASVAIYSYPRGGIQVEGPSIRLAEAIAQNYGNLDFGIVELENGNGESKVKAYCIDLETNTRSVKIFTVPHVRYSRANGLMKLTDPRDVYEMVANNGARRLRSCILSVIPGHITNNAVTICRSTMLTKYDKVKFLAAAAELVKSGVTREMIESKFRKKIEALTPTEGVRVITIANSIKDGLSNVEDWFEKESKPTNIGPDNKEIKKEEPKKEENKIPSPTELGELFKQK